MTEDTELERTLGAEGLLGWAVGNYRTFLGGLLWPALAQLSRLASRLQTSTLWSFFAIRARQATTSERIILAAFTWDSG